MSIRLAPRTPWRAVLAAGLALSGVAPAARGQSWQPNADRQSAGSHEFPSWERKLDGSALDPLPSAHQGRWVRALAVDLGGVPTGVAALLDGALAVPTLGGDVVFVSPSGEAAGRVAAGATLAWPPASIGIAAIVAGEGIVAAVARDGVLWSRQLPTAPRRGVSVHRTARDPLVLLARTGGWLERLDARDGAVTWAAELGGEVSAEPAWLPGVVVAGTASGDVVGLDADTGAELWRTTIGTAIGGLVVDQDDVYGTSRGPTPRSRRNVGPFAFRLPLLDGGRRAAQTRWRLRIGGDADVAPLLLDAVVGFATRDGYVHAVERGRGTEAWRMDLPAVVQQPPVRSAGRLDFVLALTPWLVALSAESGGVMGWTTLEDADELFLGSASSSRGLTFAATNLGRLLGFRFEPEAARGPAGPR